jgi:hypothetical protein
LRLPVHENPSKQIFLPESGKKKRVFPYPKIGGGKRVFNTDMLWPSDEISANKSARPEWARVHPQKSPTEATTCAATFA